MQLLNLVLGSKGLVRRACPVKRTARNGVEWRVRSFYAGDIFAAAISKCRLCADQSKEACDGESSDENLAQVDLLLDLQLIRVLFICETLCRRVYAHADEPRLNRFPVFEYFLYSPRTGLFFSSLQAVPNLCLRSGHHVASRQSGA
jgi:hypothetical protein